MSSETTDEDLTKWWLKQDLDKAIAERDALRTENQSLRAQLAEKEAESAVMREALKEAISLNYVPEHNQDDEWNERFTKCISALYSTSSGKAYLARMEEAVRLLSEISPAAFASTSNPSNWLKRRDTLLEQLKGEK